MPKRSIATITVLQHQAKDPKYEADKKTAGKSGAGKQEEFTHEDRLKQRIQRNPKDLTGYDELGNLYLNTDRFVEAEEVFKQKLEASNNDPTVREEIEDVQLRALRSKMVEGGKKAKESGNEADKKEYERLRMTVIEKELEVYSNRCERYPNNLIFRYELAQRYQWKGDIGEAIKQYQIAKADPRKRGMCLINLGECFRAIKQYPSGDEPLRAGGPGDPRPRAGIQEIGLLSGRQAGHGAEGLGQGRKVPHDLGQHGLYLSRHVRPLGTPASHAWRKRTRRAGGARGKREDKEERRTKTTRKAAKSNPARFSVADPLWTNSPDFGKMVDSPRAGWVLPRLAQRTKSFPK